MFIPIRYAGESVETSEKAVFTYRFHPLFPSGKEFQNTGEGDEPQE